MDTEDLTFDDNAGMMTGEQGRGQPTIQPTKSDVLYDFRVLWQSPRACKSL
jgi:hypothetical protein